MPLFQINNHQATFLKPANFANERELQRLIEANLPVFLDAQFVATEFPIIADGLQGGRIDTLALDKECSPVIIEYKKGSNSSVINQGLFYLDWLLTHKGDFEIAVQKKLGKDVVVSWDNPRVIAVAERFTVYDIYSVRRMGANVELWTYRYYNGNMLLLDTVYTPNLVAKAGKPVVGAASSSGTTSPTTPDSTKPAYTLDDHLNGKSAHIKEVLDAFRERIMELQNGEGNIVEVFRKMYIGYRRGKNFAEVHLYNEDMVIWLDIPYVDLKDPLKKGQDVSGKGHWGTGEVEIRLSKLDDLDAVMDLVAQSYQYNS